MIRILIDSSSDYLREDIKEKNLELVSLNVIIEVKTISKVKISLVMNFTNV